ncbi:hypothetical protein CCACVL1_27680 [Corchorus capsularis]|uniref:RNase H type-1 domain-containing protein n=1 Tax=Corchorus capsularis TaxID=210143 RepID=A0A1R3G9H6_COCAP|nr:hypothetical protein CCACVL1_27680 [Corchorus capsularis]
MEKAEEIKIDVASATIKDFDGEREALLRKFYGLVCNKFLLLAIASIVFFIPSHAIPLPTDVINHLYFYFCVILSAAIVIPTYGKYDPENFWEQELWIIIKIVFWELVLVPSLFKFKDEGMNLLEAVIATSAVVFMLTLITIWTSKKGFGLLIRDVKSLLLIPIMVLLVWVLILEQQLIVLPQLLKKLWALRLGLLLAWDEGYRNVECEIDASIVLQLIESADAGLHPLGSLIIDIQELFKRIWECKCLHTLREGNFSADVLSKMGCSLEEEYVVYRQPPAEVKACLQADYLGVSYPRRFKL